MTENNDWLIAPVPPNEEARLEALHSYQILDTQPELAFDRLTRLAAQRFNMPVSLISLVDRERQWFKSCYGEDMIQTRRNISMCSHVILINQAMVVHDVFADPRFCNNPLARSAANIQFYAGAPLINKNGFHLGALCIIDHKPHPEFTQKQAKELEEFAAIAVDEMELRLNALRTRFDFEAYKSTQNLLEKARRDAENATREKSLFVATISHELRTPLNGILGMAYLLGDTPLSGTQREYIDTINHSAHNLLLLVNDVLDLSKIEAGELVLEHKPFDVRTCFAQTLKLMRPLANKRGNNLHYVIDDAVPDTIVGDQGRFSQILTNLVGNAVKFTENGRVDVILTYSKEKRELHCSVKDNGIGIPDSRKNSIFNKFSQGDISITQKYGGTGLGLSITKHLVLMLGGTVGFESRAGEGSTFRFMLPATDTETPPAMERSAPAPKTERGDLVDVRQSLVLVAEDHPVNQLFLVALLKKFGFQKIDVAENGIEVMETIMRNSYGYKGRPYDAIFMDCKMPEQDGYETTRMIREQEQQLGTGLHVPIIAMTANAMSGDREACFDAGMDDYLSKPLQPERIKETISKWFYFPQGDDAALEKPATTNERPPMDFTRVQMVAETDEEKTVLLDIFFKLSKEIIGILEASRRGEEFVCWKNAAHKLKGAAANMGMAQLERICRDCEKATDNTYSERSGLVRQMKEEIAHIRAYIVKEYTNLLSPET